MATFAHVGTPDRYRFAPCCRLGYSYEDLLFQSIVWVLSRINIHSYRRPAIGEQINTRTWIKGIQQKLFFLRDFEVKDAQGAKVASASFAWLLIDLENRRILPAASMRVTLPDPHGESALDEPLEKINAPYGMPAVFVAPVTYGIVDILGSCHLRTLCGLDLRLLSARNLQAEGDLAAQAQFRPRDSARRAGFHSRGAAGWRQPRSLDGRRGKFEHGGAGIRGSSLLGRFSKIIVNICKVSNTIPPTGFPAARDLFFPAEIGQKLVLEKRQ